MDAPTVQALTTVAGLTVVTIAVTQVIKTAWGQSGAIQDRFMPLISVITGIVLAILATFVLGFGNGADLLQAAINGLFAGLAAVGTYTTVKNAATK